MKASENTDITVRSKEKKRLSLPDLMDRLPVRKYLRTFQQKLYTSQYLYLLFCFLVPFVLMYLVYVIKGIYPFYNGSPLVLDLNSQYVYFFEALRSFIYGDGSMLYSFSRSLGGEFGGIYAYYIASPFTYIVALFPKNRIQEAVLCMMLLKVGLSGLTFGFYLHKHSKRPKKTAIFTFSLLYALSAYAIVQQNNTMWMDAFLLLPLFVYGLEALIGKRKYKLYTVTLTAILIFNYYIGYMVCIFAVIYFFYYYFSRPREELNPCGQKLHFIRTGARFAIFSLIAAAIAAFMLIAAYYSLTFGKTDFSDPDWSMFTNFKILDFLTKFLPGAYDTVEPVGMPFVYCGLLSVILLPVYFAAKKISPREKIATAAVIAFFFISFWLNPLDLIWHGFSAPNWINGRYSFMFCFFLIVTAFKGFGNLRKVGERFIIALCLLILLLVAFAERFELEAYINSKKSLLFLGCVIFSIVFTAGYGVLLCLMCIKKLRKNKRFFKSLYSIIAAVVCAELLCNGVVCILQLHEDVSFTTYSSYNDSLAELRPIVGKVKEYDDGFYRMEKVKHRTRNDNMALGMRGITSSTSTLNEKAIRLINKLGYTGRAHLTMYRGGTPFSDSLLGIKYVIDYKNSAKYDDHYTRVESIGDGKFKVMENPYAMSVAYGVSKNINEIEISEYDSFFARYNSLITAMLGENKRIDLFKSVGGRSSEVIGCEAKETALYLEYTTPEKTSGTVTFKYIAPYTGNYYFYSPTSRPKELKVKFNGSPSVSYLEKDTNHILDAGFFDEGAEISVTMTIPKDTYISFNAYDKFLWYMDDEVYNDCMTRLKQSPQIAIDKRSTDDHILGSITTTDSQSTILTTIPYDKGWNLYIDGKRVETYETLDALMAFDVENSGEHSVEMKYMPNCYKLGITISVVGLLIFLGICTADFVLKKTIFKNRSNAVYNDVWTLEDFDFDEPEEADDEITEKATADRSDEYAKGECEEATENGSEDAADPER